MPSMDIFNSDAFNTVSLTTAVNKIEHKPQFLGSLGLFNVKPIRTKTVAIEVKEKTLSLIQTSPRGAPLEQNSSDVRTIRNIDTVRIAKGDRIMADEIQSVRAFGSESELQTVMGEVAERQVDLVNDVELTWENMRLGAVQGIVPDADASVLVNWYTEMGVAQPAEIDFDLDNPTPASGAVRKLCAQVVRAVARAGGGAFTLGSGVTGLCGDAFFDDLIAHPEVRATYLQQQEAAQLRQGYAFESVFYGGINFVNYRGTDDNSTVAVPTNSCKFFPTNAPGVFEVAFSPMENFQFANTKGLPLYSMLVRDKDRDMWADPEVYSYPLFVCTRPLMLQRARRT